MKAMTISISAITLLFTVHAFAADPIIYTYYPTTGYLQSKTLSVPDTSGSLYYHYRNENFGGRGYGRIDGQALAAKDADGAIAYTYQYFSATSEVVSVKKCYAAANYSSPAAPSYSGLIVTYAYYASGRLKSKTYVQPDRFGNKVYLYYDEVFYNVGTKSEYGRLRRITHADNTVTEYASYFSGTDRPSVVREYDSAMRLIVTYEYYASGRLKAKTLTTPENGSRKYLYFDEAFYNRGTPNELGRISRIYKQDGRIFVYTYWTGTDVPKVVKEYTSAMALIATYGYYGDGNLHYKLLVAVDVSGNILYHYMDENLNGRGYGRLDKAVRTVADSDGGLGYGYEYWASTETVKVRRVFSSANRTDPSNPILANLLVTYEFDAGGRLVRKTMQDGTAYTYYPDSGYVRSETRRVPDQWGNIYKYYFNEADSWGAGHGREYIEVRATPDAEGARAFQYVYDGATYNRIEIWKYAGADLSDPDNPGLTGFIARYTYYADLNRYIESETRELPDEWGNVYKHYFNEPDRWGAGHGREDVEVRLEPDADGNRAYYYEYDGDTYTRTKTWSYYTADYNEPEFPVLYSYYESGNLKKVRHTRPVYDPYPVCVYVYHYLDEDYYGNHQGRVEWKVTNLGTMYYDYAGDTDRPTRIEYRDAAGNVTRVDTYYESGNLESITLTAADGDGNIYYHYIDEVWGETGRGRLDAKALGQPNTNGEVAFEYEYYDRLWPPPFADTRTDTIHIVRSFLDVGRTAPYAVYEYDRDGNLIRTITYQITYYQDTGLRESVTLSAPGENGCVYYHYLNEDWEGQGFGRMDKKVSATPDADGKVAFEYVYYPGTDFVTEMRAYANAEVGNPSNPAFTENVGNGSVAVAYTEEYVYVHYYKNNWKMVLKHKISFLDAAKTQPYEEWEYQYYYDYQGIPGNDQNILIKHVFHCPGEIVTYYWPSGRPESKTLTTPDADGYIYYHYLDAEGETRIDKKVRREPDAAGVIAYEYFYARDGSGDIVLLRERRHFGGPEMGIAREYLPGSALPVTVIDNKTGAVYRKVFGSVGSTTLTMYYYEDYPASGNPWGRFDFGMNGETVFVKEVMCGTQVTRRFVYVHSGDLDMENGIDWSSAVKRVPAGHDWSTPIELDVPKYSVYDLSPHWPVGEPNRAAETFPFTYYPSGRVKTRFEAAVDEHWFSLSQESTGRIYEYTDEQFYSEKPVVQFLADLIYEAPGRLEDRGLKYFLTTIDANWLGITTIAGLKSYLADNATPLHGYTTQDVTNLLTSLRMDEPYEAHGRLTKVTEPDGSYTVYTYVAGTDRIASARTYRLDGALLEERIADTDSSFMKMGNLPWVRYGEDLGIRYDGWHSGFSRPREGDEELTGYEEIRAALLPWAGTASEPGYVRLFLFADLRAGIVFDANGVPRGLTNYVLDDMRVLIRAARELNIKLIPALFDYRMADGEADPNVPIPDHRDIITDQALYDGKTKAQWLVECMRPFIQAFGADETIYAWDIINEPEMLGQGHNPNPLSKEQIRGFVDRFTAMIHEETETAGRRANVTVGSLTKGEMVDYWAVRDNALAADDARALDVYQFHFYDAFKEYHPSDHEWLDFGRSSLIGLGRHLDTLIDFNAPNYMYGKPVLCGEVDPTFVTDKLDTLATHGYAGALFWDDKGNILNASERQEAREWFAGTVRTYYPSTGRLESERGEGLGDPEAVYCHYDPDGRLDVKVLGRADEAGAVAYAYEYYEGTTTVRFVRAYHSAEFSSDPDVPTLTNLVSREEFDSGGVQAGGTDWECTYYTDTWFKRSQTLDSPDRYGVTYRYFLNESWQTRDGREALEYHPSWGNAYLFQYLENEYTRIGAFKYGSIDYTDPSHPVLSHFNGYESWSSGIEAITYYDRGANIIESRTFSRPDHLGNIYYHYLNDNWHNPETNYMRVDMSQRAGPNEKGEIAFSYEYYTGADADHIKKATSYSAASRRTEDVVAVYDYDTDGRITACRMFAGPNAKGERALGFAYYDGEDWERVYTITSYSTTDMSSGSEMMTYEYNREGELIGTGGGSQMMAASLDKGQTFVSGDYPNEIAARMEVESKAGAGFASTSPIYLNDAERRQAGPTN